MHDNHRKAHRAGLAAPERPISDEPPAVAAAQGFTDLGQGASFDFQSDGIAEQAAQVIEGEVYARAYLDRLNADMSQPGDLATLLSFLTGEMLRGACRVIEKVLRGQHNA